MARRLPRAFPLAGWAVLFVPLTRRCLDELATGVLTSRAREDVAGGELDAAEAPNPRPRAA